MTDNWQMQADQLMTDAESLDMGQCIEALASALSAAYEAGKREEREACARIAEAYADENWQMTMDSIINDPILARNRHGVMHPITKAELAISETETINGAVHSSMYHAAKNIAEAIRSREDKA